MQDCLQPDWPNSVSYKNGTASALADPEGAVSDGYLFSAELLSLPQNLSQSTLLTGIGQLVGTLFLLENSSITFAEATRPRFEWSHEGDVVTLSDSIGHFTVDIMPPARRSMSSSACFISPMECSRMA